MIKVNSVGLIYESNYWARNRRELCANQDFCTRWAVPLEFFTLSSLVTVFVFVSFSPGPQKANGMTRIDVERSHGVAVSVDPIGGSGDSARDINPGELAFAE